MISRLHHPSHYLWTMSESFGMTLKVFVSVIQLPYLKLVCMGLKRLTWKHFAYVVWECTNYLCTALQFVGLVKQDNSYPFPNIFYINPNKFGFLLVRWFACKYNVERDFLVGHASNTPVFCTFRQLAIISEGHRHVN